MVLVLAVELACGNDAASGGEDKVEISLDELNGSGQSGTATLTASGGGTEVVLSLGEGTMKSKPVHIHNGLYKPHDSQHPHPLFLRLHLRLFYTTARTQSRFCLDQTYEGLGVEPRSSAG